MVSAKHPLAHVAFLVNSLCVGGAEKQVVSLLNGLRHPRLETSLLSLKRDDALLPQLDTSRLAHGITHLDVERGLEWGAVRRLARHLEARAVDVLLCTNMYALAYGALARMASWPRRRLRLVEVYHTTLPGSPRDALQMRLAGPLVAQADLLIYVCEAQAAYWRARGLRARREAVIHNGIDVERHSDRWTEPQRMVLRQRLGFGSQDYLVGLCAVMRPEKAHGDLLQALARLAQGGLRVHALLIGVGPERSTIEQQIRSFGLQGQVRITGYADDVRPLVAACDAMVIASRTVETFSIAALEAMALGRPMIMSDIGGAREQVRHGENGLLFPPGNIAALADQLHRLADARLRRRMGLRSRERVVQEFDLGRMLRRYEEALLGLTCTEGAG